MSATVSLESCVRSLSIGSQCERCKDACGFEAIDISGYSVRIEALKCTECALCAAVCPTGAIALPQSSVLALSADELFCVALDSSDELCIDAQAEFESICQQRVNEANILLRFFGASSKITLNVVDTAKNMPEDGSKRALFKMFTKSGIEAAHNSVKSEEEIVLTVDYSLLKSKKVPAKRALFLNAVDSLELLDKEAACELSFASDKHIDDSCDNCSLCYNLCPSGALETTQMKNAIVFSPHLCLKCRLCEDICEPKAISSLPKFDIAAFKEKRKKVLIKFKVKLCKSCGAIFSGDSEECPRCTLENEDAMELLGL